MQNSMLISNPWKSLKKCTQKSYKQNKFDNINKSGHFCKTLLFCKFFKNFFNGFKIRVKLCHINTFSNFETKRAKTAQKNKNLF